MTVITMSRQVGSGAEQVANRVCEDLGLRIFDKTLMLQVAAEVGFSEAEVVDYSENEYRVRGFFEALFSRNRMVAERTMRTRATEGAEVMGTVILDEARAITLIRMTINSAYDRGNILVIGRGGQAILEDKSGVLHVRIVAPVEQRIKRLQEQEKITAPQARRLIAERDRATAEYLRNFHNIDVDDPTLYHLVQNTGKLGIDKCVELIKVAVV